MTKLREPEKVALMLALGNTKKEVAQKLNKSVNTVENQTQQFYRETGSRNLADSTRKIIARHTGMDIDNILKKIMRDAIVICLVAFITYLAHRTGILEELKASLIKFVRK